MLTYEQGRERGRRASEAHARKRVPVDPVCAAVAEALYESETSWNELSRRVYDKADVTRLRRALGLARFSHTHLYAQRINRDIAARIVRAAGADPVRAGL